ncbi:MAG: hypothetical protein LBJ89_00705 [Holosporales bacterium]|jgi:hypothetical protein|nr:hypothetical protein [Holosporales bacterium]
MSRNTSQVILATGELYPKFDLKPGMILLGAESQPLALKGVETRRVPAFEVKPQKSESFLVGLDQKILAMSKTNEPLLLPAKDYVEFSANLQQKFSLAKAILDFPESELPLDPYFQGLLLGNDKSDTKFIPKQYLFADKKSRQALLAGLLDTDGYLAGRYYDFKTSSQQLADDIAFLARSLGLTVFENRHPKTSGCVARLYIHGDFSEIPIRIRRKISSVSRQYFERFTIKPAGIQGIQYLDIESYLLGDCTIRIGDHI